jgi:hypothetical protein
LTDPWGGRGSLRRRSGRLRSERRFYRRSEIRLEIFFGCHGAESNQRNRDRCLRVDMDGYALFLRIRRRSNEDNLVVAGWKRECQRR